MKNFFKNILQISGFKLSRFNQKEFEIASDKRPVGQMDLLLEDLRARGLNCKSILDIGANWSGWSRMAKKIFPSASFYLIEPQIEMEEQLKKFCAEFQDSVYFLAGAGARKGVLTLTVWDDLNGSSFLPESSEKLQISGKQRQVEILTIDYLIESSKIRPPDLIKLDIQGFELEALKGAEKTFGYTEIYILEVSLYAFTEAPTTPLFTDVVNFMFQRDYVLYDFGGFSRRPLDGALAQLDICFVKKTGFLRKSNGWK